MSNIERKLASIRAIKEIRPIKEADAIETAVIDGWTVVVKKGEFSVGDECVYFEIDSFLPENDYRFDFLRKTSYRIMNNKPGFRIKTVKLRGQLSQGLALPRREFPEISSAAIGDCVTEALRVEKWEPVLPTAAADIAGRFPSSIPRTDQERVQNIFDDLKKYHVGESFEVTLKLDGASVTIYKMDDEFGVCSRNYKLKETENSPVWRAVRKSGINHFLNEVYSGDIAVQCELMGPGVD